MSDSSGKARGDGDVNKQDDEDSKSGYKQEESQVQVHDFAVEERQAEHRSKSRDEVKRPETARAPIEGLELIINYLESLRDQPCTLLDMSQAQSYASYPTSEKEVDAVTRPPIRIWSSKPLIDIMDGRRWIVDCLSTRCRAVLREFLLDVSMDRPPTTLKLEFVQRNASAASEYSESLKSSGIIVDFKVGLISSSVVPKHLRERYPSGLAVLSGTTRRQVDISSSSQKGGHNLQIDRSQSPSPSLAPIVSSSKFKRRKHDSEKGSLVDMTSFALDTFKQQPCRIADTEAGRLFLHFPWHETSLGPLSHWPPRFRAYVTMALSQPTAINLGLGSDYLQIYNDAYIEGQGAIHPSGFGQPGAKAWGTAWYSTIGPLVKRSAADRKSYSKPNHLFWQQPSHVRHGVDTTGKDSLEILDEQSITLLETYRTISHGPLFSDEGDEVDGYAGLDIDTTDSVIARRRLATARDLQLAIAPALSLRSFYELAIGALETNPIDLPFVLLYSVHTQLNGQGGDRHTSISGDSFTLDPHTTTDEMSNESNAYTGTVILRLQASSGLLDDHVAKYRHLQVMLAEDDDVSEASTPFPIEEAIRSNAPVHTFVSDQIAGHFANRSWQSKTNRAVVCPVQLESRKLPDCIMVVGLNSRRIYKDIYRKWLDQLTRCMRSGLTSAHKVAREQKHLRNLRKLDEAKTAFFTSVSHELRTPLTLINGPAADALAERGLSQLNRNRFDLISRASNRLLRLVNSLLDFASVDAGRLKANFTPVYLCSYVEDLASLFRSAVERAGLTFSVHVQGRDVVYTDRAAFEKIMFNLLSNALKYTVYGKIEVSAFTTRTEFIMEVSDTGTGIPEDQLQDIFKRFYRVDNKQARSVEGTGIGLALTKELSKLLHGDLTVESTTTSGNRTGSAGSTFRLTLPLGQKHLPPDAISRDAVPSSHSDSSNEFSKRAIADELVGAFGQVGGSGSIDDDANSGGGSGADLAVHREANILVVDDHDDLRNYIMSILGGVCRSVTGVSDGEAALAILQTNARIDLVVSDIMMPKMDGFQLLQAIRSDPRLSNLPVIMLSARAGSEVTAEGIELGATDYLPKPFSSKELTARVRNALANAKNSRRLEALVEERTAELVASERRAERLMGVLPVGVFELSAEGHITYTNEAFRRMSGWLGNDSFYIDEWYKRIRREDRGRVQSVVVNALATAGEPVDTEGLVVNWQWESSGTDGSRNHCFGQLYPTADSFVGVLTDITPSIRLAEQSIQHEKQRAHDAINLARSQESFLDVVSHELRNPLSAILNCADLCTANFEAMASLLDQLSPLEDEPDTRRTFEDLRGELEEAAESIQGIIASARHQSLIAGDILSVSKFNRGLLTVTPVDICLCRELNTILSMFEMQTRATQITMSLRLSSEIREDLCVSADPTRLTQILVNLISNSCRILENYDGFRRGTDDGLGQLDRTKYAKADAPIGTDIWLLFLVRDTGPGISNEMQAHLFTKFNQAQTNGSMGATRSAVGGGAGLGLYLAKKLAELMGGSMTVKSVVGHGADFIFYIKTSKARYVEAKEILKIRSRGPKYAQRALGQSGTSSRSSFSTVTSLDGNSSSSTSGEAQRALSPLATDGPPLAGPLSPPPNNRGHLRVLVCEDNLLNQKLLYRQLSKSGIETTVANNGLEAIEKLLQSNRDGRPINVCLMDLEMPVCGGIEAAAKIRSLEREGELPGSLIIYAVTGNARDQHARECKEVGMNSTIVKPYDFRDMLAKLDALRLA